MLDLLQRGVNKAPPPADPGDALAVGFGVICCYGVVILLALVVGLTIKFFFLRTLVRCLQEVAPRNRTMEPGQVWLNFIPLFDIVWMILTILRVAESLKSEYEDRDLDGDDDYGKTTGLVYYIAGVIGCGPVSLVGLIMYWVKISNYTKQLAEAGGGRSGRRDDDDEDEEDDRPSRRRRPGDDDEDDDR